MLANIFTVILIIIFSLSAESYELVFSDVSKDTVLYKWQASRKDQIKGRIVEHTFPPFDLWETYTENGIQSKLYRETEVFAPADSLVYGCGVRLEQPVQYQVDRQTSLNMKIFATNLKTIHIWVHILPENKWMQVLRQSLKRQYSSIKIRLSDGKEHPLRSISDIRVMGEVNGSTNQLVVGDIEISAYRTISWKDGEDRPDPIFPAKGYKLFAHWPKYIQNYGSGTLLKLNGSDVSQIWRFYEDLLHKYPRYHLKKRANKRETLGQHQNLVKSNPTLTEYYNGLHDILIPLEDSHFRIKKQGEKKKKIRVNDVIKFYRIRDRVVVVGVFDPNLQKQVSTGDEVVEIDDIPIEDYIERQAESIYGSTWQIRERIAIERLLVRDPEKEIKMTLRRSSGQVFSIKHTTRDSFQRIVPANFLRSRFHYKKLREFAYLRIGRWDEKTWPFFYSYIDSLRESKGLILDLRSNSGGDLSVCRLAACFLSKPSELFLFQKRNEFGQFETFVVNPDPFFHYKEPVVILADNRTSCASELFISAMKKHYTDCTLIGPDATSGAVGLTWTVDLPGGHQVIYPELAYDAFRLDLEGRGIEPDVYVHYDSYRSLAPYKNKLVDVGLEHLSRMRHRRISSEQSSIELGPCF